MLYYEEETAAPFMLPVQGWSLVPFFLPQEWAARRSSFRPAAELEDRRLRTESEVAGEATLRWKGRLKHRQIQTTSSIWKHVSRKHLTTIAQMTTDLDVSRGQWKWRTPMHITCYFYKPMPLYHPCLTKTWAFHLDFNVMMACIKYELVADISR